MSSIRIGTSGWMYNHWKKIFYPERIAQKDLLSFYSRSFETVEINSTFYGTPSKSIVNRWRESVPEKFIFSLKANRYFTHRKRLLDTGSYLNDFFSKIANLQDKSGPIVFQLGPNFKINTDRLENFIGLLPAWPRYVFEFRNETWYKEEIFRILKKNNIALCNHDNIHGGIFPFLSADFAYVRFHGAKKNYSGEYSVWQLTQAARQIELWKRKKIDIFCYFNNDAKGWAVKNALQLIELLK